MNDSQTYQPTGSRTQALPSTPATGTSHINVGPAERIVSVIVGTALAVYGLRRQSGAAAVGLTTLGTSLVLRGANGFCPLNEIFGRDAAPAQLEPIEIKETMVINRPVEEVYAYWRHLENLPRFMKHLHTVRQLTERRSHWEARIPGGLGTVAWESEITLDEPNRLLAYRSVPGSQVDQSGEVRFCRAADGAGTEMQTIMHYRAPLGALGQGVAKLLNPVAAQLVRDDVRRFKQALEVNSVS